MSITKKILISPLDWGLGHATRCIPIIRELLKYNSEVFVAADNRPMALLKEEFTRLKFIRLAGYDIEYPLNGAMSFKMVTSIPKILAKIRREHLQLKKISEEYKINGVISDNRYGLWAKELYSVFITHQIRIKCPPSINFAEPVLCKINRMLISNFNECWIPDFEEEPTLSGQLSHKVKLPPNTFYVGALSRFPNKKEDEWGDKKSQHEFDVMVILSGPEPQRSILEAIMINQLKSSSLKSLIIQGTPESKTPVALSENITVIPHLSSGKMLESIISSKLIISRPGYSSIMDLAALGKRAVFIPTPGQTEQEYLAEYYFAKKMFYYQTQSSFNLNTALLESEKFDGFKIKNFNGNLILQKRIESFLDKL